MRRRSIRSGFIPSSSAARRLPRRGANRRTWTYRIRPSVTHARMKRFGDELIRSGPFNEVPTPPNQMRWDPLPIPAETTDFVDGIVTLGGNGDPAMQTGVAIHLLRGQRVDAGPLLLQRRRRDADRAADRRLRSTPNWAF